MTLQWPYETAVRSFANATMQKGPRPAATADRLMAAANLAAGPDFHTLRPSWGAEIRPLRPFLGVLGNYGRCAVLRVEMGFE